MGQSNVTRKTGYGIGIFWRLDYFNVSPLLLWCLWLLLSSAVVVYFWVFVALYYCIADDKSLAFIENSGLTRSLLIRRDILRSLANQSV